MAGTDAPPISTREVRISLSTDGGATYPYVLAASTPNDGSATVTLPNAATTRARIKVEAVGNVFFDVSDADVTIQGAPGVTVHDQTVQYSDAAGPDTVVEATDDDSPGSALSATATDLPDGLSLAVASTSEHARTWALAGTVTAAPGTYTATVSVADGDGEAVSRPLTVTVTPEDAELAYTGDTLSSGSVLLRATVADADDGSPGDLARRHRHVQGGRADAVWPAAGGGGLVSCRVSLARGSHTVDVVAGGYYTGATSAQVRVAKPRHTRVFASGDLIVGSSAGPTPPTCSRGWRSRSTCARSITAGSGRRRGRLRVGRPRAADLRRPLRLAGGVGRRRAGRVPRRRGRLAAGVEVRPRTIPRDAILHVTVDEARTVAISVWDGNTLLFSLPEQAIRRGAISIK